MKKDIGESLRLETSGHPDLPGGSSSETSDTSRLLKRIDVLEAENERLRRLSQTTDKRRSRDDASEAITVSGIHMSWHPEAGVCEFEGLRAAMMWVDTTLAGLMAGLQAMVGTERFNLALQSEGRKSIEVDWRFIRRFPDFTSGFNAVANIAAVAGWGRWEIAHLDTKNRECRFRVHDSWEGRYQRALGFCWGSGMLAGKLAGICSKLFKTPCWAYQTAFIAEGDNFDAFVVRPSERSVEQEIENLLATDAATRADMAVALEQLRKEIHERRRAETELREAHEHLEKRVALRTAELREANEQLSRGERKFRNIIESSPMGIHLYRLHGDDRLVFTGANPAAEQILGVDHQAFIGKTIETVFPELEATGIPEKYRNVCKSGVPWQTEQIEYAHGRIKGAFEVHAFQTAPDSMAVMFQDVTPRLKAEADLRNSEDRFRRMVENSPFAMTIVDTNAGILEYANPVFERLFKYRLDEIRTLKKWMAQAYPDKAYREEVARTWESDIRSELSGNLREFEVTCGDGRVRRILWRLISLGETRQLVIAEDKTEQRRAEIEKEALRRKLFRFRKMEAVGLLASGVAHDLNNILSGVVNYPELLLLDLPADSPLKEPLEKIHKSGERAAAVVQDLLTIGRGAAMTRTPMNANAVVEDYLDSIECQKLLARYPRIQVRTSLAPDLMNMNGSAVHIRKTLMNLVINAAEAIADAGIVTISTRNQYVDRPLRKYETVNIGEYVVLGVADNGQGISEEDRDRIFEPFYTRKVLGRSGTGLGLAVVWNTVQDHDGYIVLESDGRGTRFELYFPATRLELQAPDLTVPLENLKGGGERVLVVDDEESQRDIACRMLKLLGYRPTPAAGGEAAVALAEKEAFDIVLLDMIMPAGMDGRAVYERLIRIRPGQKAVIASGFAETENVRVIQRLGAGPYLKKPYTIQTLGEAIRSELRQERHRSEK